MNGHNTSNVNASGAKARAPRGGVKVARPRAERGSISSEQILEGAQALARGDGLDALSMPRLAERLGIGVTSIYWYFRNKNELIEAMTVEAARKFHALIHPPEDQAWDAALFDSYCRLRDAMQDDELACDLLFLRGGRAADSALIHMWPGAEASIRRMVIAGFTPQEALQNIVVLSLYTRGCMVLARQMQRAGLSPDAPTPVPPEFPLFTQALEGQNTRGVSVQAYRAQLRDIIEGMVLRLREKTAG